MLKIKTLANNFKNCLTFLDLKEYINKNVDNNEISYETLKYLYKNLYYKKSLFLKQNIYPVCEFLKKGYSIQEAEKLAKLLDDANGLTVFSNDKSNIGYKYNKLFYDLLFIYDFYDKIIKNGLTKDEAYSKAKCEIKITSAIIREVEMQLQKNELISQKDISNFDKLIAEEVIKIKEEMLNLSNKGIFENTNLIEKYNRLNKTKRLIKNYSLKISPNKDYVTR